MRNISAFYYIKYIGSAAAVLAQFYSANVSAQQQSSYVIPCERDGQSIAGEQRCSAVKEFLKSNLKTEVSGIIEDYYMGRERIDHAGKFMHHLVPVCNFFQGEGLLDDWAKNSSSCKYDTDTALGKNSCPRVPDAEEGSKRNYNDLMGSASLAKSFKHCGSFCEFEFSKCKKPDFGDALSILFSTKRDSSIAEEFVEVTEKGTCQREYAWQRGLYVQGLWKHTETVLQEIDSGSINLQKLGTTAPCENIRTVLNQTWAAVDQADALFSKKQLDGLIAQPERVVSHCKELELPLSESASEAVIKKVNEAQLQSGFSQDVCLIKAAKFAAIRLMVNLAKCEVISRTQNQWIDDRAVFEKMVMDLQKNVEEICEKTAELKSNGLWYRPLQFEWGVYCKEDVLNACYKRELHRILQKRYLSGAELSKWQTATAAPVRKIRNPQSYKLIEASLQIHPPTLANKINNQIEEERKAFNSKTSGGSVR